MGTHGDHDGVKVLLQLRARNVLAHVHAGLEHDAFGLHHLQAAINDLLFHLEIGDAVAQQAADAAVALEHGHGVPGPVQLLGRGQAGGTGADDSNLLAGALLGRFGFDPAFREGAFHDFFFDQLDGHGRLVDAQYAGLLAGGGAQTAGEFREVVGGVQAAGRLAPFSAVHQVVEVRDDVAERAAGVAEGHAAIHAARGLLLGLLFREGLHELAIGLQPLPDRELVRQFAGVFFKSSWLSHKSIVGVLERWSNGDRGVSTPSLQYSNSLPLHSYFTFAISLSPAAAPASTGLCSLASFSSAFL